MLGTPLIRPLQPTSKLDRGFENDDTGRLLCPIEYNWDDPKWAGIAITSIDMTNPPVSSWSVRTHIRDGHPDFIVTADSWPAFLYPNAKGDIDNIELGLFRSAIFLKVCIDEPHKSEALTSIWWHARLISSFSRHLPLP